ncbi:MAG: lysine biosynthesis protein LysW [Euryarchaeota archaeon]|jgi:alpha-aminoadipate carrier protein LysW|nr:lysine biosynthesis protein LysW [Euryarchaeota archaeon]
MAECIECGYEIATKEPVVGEIIGCPDCGVELEVVNLTPVEFEHAPEEKEDWGE